MCNACGNWCCGSDMFAGCGCDGCDEPECWSDDDDLPDDDDYDGYDMASRQCRHHHFECVEVFT